MAASKERQDYLRLLRKSESKETKLCLYCEKILPLDSFSKESRNRKRRATRCRSCVQSLRFEKLNTPTEVVDRIKRQIENRNREDKDTKACSACLRVFPLAFFSKAKKRRKGRCSECKECRKEYKAKTKERNRWTAIFRLYGMTKEHFENTLKKQNGKCKICCSTSPGKGNYFAVDHCHTTGKIRGLLCNNCNLALGLMGDDPKLLQDAAKYLEENQ
jgi:hypothetical protein